LRPRGFLLKPYANWGLIAEVYAKQGQNCMTSLNSRQTGMRWDTGGGGPREARLIAGIAEIARHRRNRKRKTQLLPLINTDHADRNKTGGSLNPGIDLGLKGITPLES
jgi:hypothetical protein